MSNWREFTGPLGRGGFAGWYLMYRAQREPGAKTTTAEMALFLGVTWRNAYRILEEVARQTPLYHDREGWWYEPGDRYDKG